MEFQNFYFNVTPLYAAIESENIELVQLLLMNERIDVNLMNKTLCHYKNYKEFDKWFTEWDIDKWFDFDPDEFEDSVFFNRPSIKKNVTALYQAIEMDNIEIINLLLMNNKIDVNIKNTFYHYFCVEGGEGEIGIKYEVTPLNLAIEKENIEIVKLLLIENSIDVNLANYKLLYANDASDVGANLSILTPLGNAIDKNNTEIVRLLMLNKNIDVNIKLTYADEVTNGADALKENTPLYLAIKKDNIDIVKLLLNNDKFDVNSSSFRYCSDLDEFDYFQFSPKFTTFYDDRKRYTLFKTHKNVDLIKTAVEQKKIEPTEKISKWLK